MDEWTDEAEDDNKLEAELGEVDGEEMGESTIIISFIDRVSVMNTASEAGEEAANDDLVSVTHLIAPPAILARSGGPLTSVSMSGPRLCLAVQRSVVGRCSSHSGAAGEVERPILSRGCDSTARGPHTREITLIRRHVYRCAYEARGTS